MANSPGSESHNEYEVIIFQQYSEDLVLSEFYFRLFKSTFMLRVAVHGPEKAELRPRTQGHFCVHHNL